MNITSIIAEYNPLHKGHEYHIKSTLESLHPDYMITILSGNYVQRGQPALLDKYTRTRMALMAGSDLVIELPTWYALSSAEGFAFGAISILSQLQAVTHVSFGSEAGSLNSMLQTARFLQHETIEYQQQFKQNLKQGMSFPKARVEAIKTSQPEIHTSFLEGKSNNLLGLEYCRSLLQLNSKIEPFTILRNGDAYLSTTQQHLFPSATSIRHRLEQGLSPASKESIASYVETEIELARENNSLVFLDDLSQILHYKLLSLTEANLLQYYEVNLPLAKKIKRDLYQYQTFSQFANLLWSKDLTYARVCRCLLHILLEMKQDDWDSHRPCPYARILGFRKESSALLSLLKKNTSIPLISKLSQAREQLSQEDYRLLELDMRSADIYQSILTAKAKTPVIHEMKQKIVIL